MTTEQLLAPLYHLELIRDKDIPYYQSASTTEEAAQVLHELSDKSPVETLMVIYLNSDSRIIGVERVGMGGIESVGAAPAEIFRGAIVKGAPEIILSHNHPTEGVRPSIADIKMTMNAVNMGSMLGVRVRDHIVVGINNKHMSMRENMTLLHKDFEQAEDEMMGGAFHGIKEKLLSLLDAGERSLPGSHKKSGDPKANTNSDWKQSLSYLLLKR